MNTVLKQRGQSDDATETKVSPGTAHENNSTRWGAQNKKFSGKLLPAIYTLYFFYPHDCLNSALSQLCSCPPSLVA
jgi:hypothetical protein